MEYESRRCLPYSLSYPSYYTPQGISHTTRTNPNGYTLGGPVGGMPYRMNVGRDDMAMESGSARRRIAVAVSSLCRSFPQYIFFRMHTIFEHRCGAVSSRAELTRHSVHDVGRERSAAVEILEMDLGVPTASRQGSTQVNASSIV